MHAFVCRGMDESDGLCLQIETIGLFPIQFVTYYRTPETIGMGAVHP